MKATSYTKMKRLLALILTICMVMGCMSLGAFGESSQNQVVSNGETVTTTDGKVKHSKIITQTGENEFRIDLTVMTKEDVQTQVVSQDAAVVLVLDVSNSMSGDDIKAAKTASENFVTEFIKDAGEGQRKVSIVEFGSNAKTVLGWTDAKGSGKTTVDDGIGLITKNFSYATNWWPEKDGGGTNMEGALRLANNLLGMNDVSSIGNKYVVLMTDGVPTCYVSESDESSSTTFMKGTIGGGNYATHNDYHDIYCPSTNQGSNHVNHGDNIPKQIKDKGARIYTLTYKTSGSESNVNGVSIDSWLASFATQNITANTDLFGGLASIAQIIVNQAQAWILTDPMGDYIDFDSSDIPVVTNETSDSSDAVVKFNSDTNTMIWNLRNDVTRTGPSNGWYTYKKSYTITLDTAAEGFSESVNYPANGTTTLTYMLTVDNQLQPNLESTELVVPVVKGELPEYTFKVEHYVKDDAGNYPQDPTTTEADGTYDRWTEFAAATYKDSYLAELGANYQIDSYHFIEGTETNAKEKIELVKDSVLKIYYSRVPVTVTVNKFIRNDTIDASGTRTSTAYTGLGSKNYTVGKGSRFTVPEAFLESYALVDTKEELSALTAEENLISDPTTIETVNGSEVINLYYYTELNQAAVEVHRTFEEWGYKFNETTKKFDTEMTCLKKWTEENPIVYAAEIEFPGNVYTYRIPAAAEGATEYEYEYVNGSALLDGKKVSDADDQVIVNPTTNKTYRVDVTYKKTADNRGPLYTVQVKHNYTYNEYKIVNGALSKEPVVTKNTGIQNEQVDVVKGYKGEVAKLYEQPVYGGVTYTPTAQNAENGVEDGVLTYTFGEGATYDLYYTKDVYPKTTGATVISEFYTLTPIINTTTGAITYDHDEHPDYTNTDIYPEKNADYVLYEGQKFTGPEPTHTEYPIDEANNNVIDALDIDPSKNVIVLKYYRYSDPDLETAQAKIIHNYYSRFTAVIDGKVTTTNYAPDASEQYSSGYGKVGEEYTGFDFIRKNGGYKYTEEDPEQDLTAIYGGKTVVVNYYREDKNLEPISINVIHNYYTRHMSVKEVNGVLTADYFEDGIEPDGSSEEFVLLQDGKEVTGLYKNMVVDIKLEKTYGGQVYELEANTLYLDILVTEGGKTYILNYFKDDELGKVQPTVTHTYYDINYDYVEGVEQEPKTVENKDLASTVTGNKDYVGLTYDAATSSMGYKLVKCVVNGEEVALDTLKDGKYVLTLAADKANKVEYTYEKINNKLEAASIVVQHYYTTIDDYTGTVTGYVPGEAYTPLRYETKSYATMSFTASHNHLDGEFPDEPTSDREQTVVLVPGDNGVINLYYVRHFSSRAKVSAVENHSYFVYDKYTDITTEVEELNWSKETTDLWEGENFSATPDTKGDYEMQTAEDDLTIVLLADSELNVVNVKYLKTIDSTPDTPHNPRRPKPVEPEEPEPIVEPEVPEEPIVEEPEIIEDLPEEEVPLAGLPEEPEELEIFEEEVPLADVPATGDGMLDIVVIMVASAVILLGYALLSRLEGKKNK